MPSPNHPRCILAGIVFVAALTSSLPARADVLEVSPTKDNTLIETPMFNSNGAGRHLRRACQHVRGLHSTSRGDRIRLVDDPQ